MLNKRNQLLILISLVLIFSMGCFITDLFSTVKDAVNSGSSSSSDDASSSGSSSSDVVRVESGGYEFVPLNNYDLSEEFGIATLLEPGADPQTGPSIVLLGGTNDSEMTNEELIDQMKTSVSNETFSEPKKVKVDGISGLDVDITSTLDGVDLEGRMVVVMVTPTQQFMLIAVAPEGEFGPVDKDFTKIMKTVKFFEPVEPVYTQEPTFEFTEVPVVEVTEEPSTVDTSDMLRQWASSGKASSEYGTDSWSANQATGAPNVDTCVDDSRAWAAASATSVEWIELTYDTPVIPYEITIIQSYNPSQVVDITAIDVDGNEYSIYEGEPEYIDSCPDYWTFTITPEKEARIKKLRITVDQSVLGLGWDEIDAVEMVGLP